MPKYTPYKIHDVLVKARHEMLTKGWGQDAEIIDGYNPTAEQQQKINNDGVAKVPWATFAAAEQAPSLCAIGSVFAVICKNVVINEYDMEFEHMATQRAFETRVLKYLLKVINETQPYHVYNDFEDNEVSEPWDDIPEWNDAYDRTFDQVLSVFECAIARAKREKI